MVLLFSGPGITDAARADLKSEMTKKNVRKTIVDGVLSKILSGGGNSSEGNATGGSRSSLDVPGNGNGRAALISRSVSAPIIVQGEAENGSSNGDTQTGATGSPDAEVSPVYVSVPETWVCFLFSSTWI